MARVATNSQKIKSNFSVVVIANELEKEKIKKEE